MNLKLLKDIQLALLANDRKIIPRPEKSKGMSKNELKKYWRNLALFVHPDKKNGSEKQFRELTTAFESLEDSTPNDWDKVPTKYFDEDWLKETTDYKKLIKNGFVVMTALLSGVYIYNKASPEKSQVPQPPQQLEFKQLEFTEADEKLFGLLKGGKKTIYYKNKKQNKSRKNRKYKLSKKTKWKKINHQQ